ncbi:hypothetical protein VTN02DRAFT_4329 [Thermoascus thermophilus]
MKVLAAPTDDEFDSLPPALRRKFFSNLERLRLERLRLAQNDHNHGHDYRFALSGVIARKANLLHPRKFRTVNSCARTRSRQKQNYSPRRLRKPESLQVAYLAAQADSQWFHSLPQKIQQTHFSREEQIRFHHGGLCGSVILDAADEIFYRLGHQRRASPSPRASPAHATVMSSSASVATSESSDSPADSATDMGELRRSFYDSFRWLDGDGDLDLSLDDYHSHAVDTVPPPKQPHRRKPSFRRTLSFTTSMHLGRHSISSLNHRISTSSQSNASSSFGPQTNRFSLSRPVSGTRTPRHAAHRSTSSIDPSAQYYQDPEARLKLRVYLASPQKFDEAIEFGFPSLDDKENVHHPMRPSGEPRRRAHESGHTFLDDNDDDDPLSVHESPPTDGRDQGDEEDDLGGPRTRKSSKPLQPLSTCAQGSGRNREMTLKMTLTRPDLRTTDSFTTSPSVKDLDDDPLKLADLPPVDENSHPWDSSSGERGMVKKMWRKIRRR